MAVLAEQQPTSRYPFRWPLPFPVEQFIVREAEKASWVAEIDDRPVGHVSVGRPRGDLAESEFLRITGRTDVATVSVLFVATSTQGSGVGGRLLDTAVAWAREPRTAAGARRLPEPWRGAGDVPAPGLARGRADPPRVAARGRGAVAADGAGLTVSG